MNFLPKPYHFVWHDTLVFFIGIAIGLLALIIRFVAYDSEQEIDSQNGKSKSALIPFPFPVFANTFIFLIIHSMVQQRMPLMTQTDEYCRAFYGFLWSRDPFFAVEDHIWLAGQFYFIGTAYKIIGNLEVATRVLSVIGIAATAAAATNLGALFTKSRIGAFVGGLFGSTHWILLWASTSATAEVFFWPAALIALNFWILSAQSNDTDEKHKKYRYLFFAALCIGFGNMFRFESWYIGIPFGIYLTIQLLFSFKTKSNADWKIKSLIAGSMLVLAAYPLSHMISAWVNLGSPIASFADNSKINSDMNIWYGESLISKFLAYPSILWDDHWYFLPTMLLGMILSFSLSKKYKWSKYFNTAFWVVFIFAVCVSVQSGIGSSLRPRFTAFFILFLTAYSALCAAIIHDSKNTILKYLGYGLIAFFCLLLIGNNFLKVNYRIANYWNTSMDDMHFITLTKLEKDFRINDWEYQRIHPHNFVMKVYSHGDWTQHWGLVFHSRQPELVQFIYHDGQLREEASFYQRHTSFAIKKPIPENHGLDQYYYKAFDFPGWEVWQTK